MDRQFENNTNGTAAAQNLNFAMQEYLVLHDQHEELCQRLHELCPPPALSPTTTSSSSLSLSLASTATPSPSVSSTRSFSSGDGISPLSQDEQRTSQPQILSTTRHRGHVNPREPAHSGSLGEVAAGERKLFDVNEGMKRALTELLNCEMVRQDRAMRTWVQTRLMETEKELRRERRRRSSATVE
ncbi:hypothetical protein F4777DRAFT_76124 [Nemania sp. FL0916]|nr:hypothetical protein F4777DRAFT_76124 [Nemania sp. FL0916]